MRWHALRSVRLWLIVLTVVTSSVTGVMLGIALSMHGSAPTGAIIHACEDGVLTQPIGVVTGGFSAERASPSMLNTFLVQGNVTTTQGLRQWTCTAQQDGKGEWVATSVNVLGRA